MNSHFRSKLNDRCSTIVPHREAPDSRGLSDSYNDLYGEAPPQRFPFFSLQVYERVGILKRPKRDDRFI